LRQPFSSFASDNLFVVIGVLLPRMEMSMSLTYLGITSLVFLEMISIHRDHLVMNSLIVFGNRLRFGVHFRL
jgi:hypothetical protein